VNAASLEELPPGPILVVADNDAIAEGGLRWARRFQAAQRLYRVRLAGPSTVDAVVAEARSFNAVAIITAGTPETHARGKCAATRLGILYSSDETLNDAPLR
jgi:hypothetical protein